MVGINRNKDVIFKKGANWVSVTQSFVEYILSNREIIKQMFCYTYYCADEMFIQTLLYNSGFKDCLYIPKKQGNIICVCVKLIGIGAIHISGIMEILNI